ncbi:MAG: hypothetical protein TREMPRED_004430 [Tremellales sp. Tagirdzhanova-0007]|nr:MAG: hypothetical protein TREMPRED_004430 [Tremellales sp. Tagirdzhanova-0007]
MPLPSEMLSVILLITSMTFVSGLVAPVVRDSDVLFELDSAKATFYYDLTNSLCDYADGGPAPANWAVTSGINTGHTYCEYHATNPKTMADLGTNRIVAIIQSMVWGDPSEWVIIFDSTGTQVQFSEGSFILWDSCQACMSAGIIDLSAKAYDQINGGTCGGTGPTGLKVQILNNNIWAPITASGGDGDGSSSTSATPAATPQAVNTASPAGSAISPAVGPSSGAATGGSCSTKGDHQCAELDLLTCNHVSSDTQLSTFGLPIGNPKGVVRAYVK